MHQISNIYFVIKLCMFRASSVPIIRSYLLYAQQLVCSMQAMWPLPSRDRLELQFQQKMPQTCRVLWQNKCWIFDAYSWLFYTEKKNVNSYSRWETLISLQPWKYWQKHSQLPKLPKNIFVSILIFIHFAHIIKCLGSLFAKLSPFFLFFLHPLSYPIRLLLPFP